ncbi:MAG: hypothetical protein JXA96_14910 [Sedimentisphaerales bacterium]|nr:hypothetical protein [Sedimentisphaerales bacterium]
MTEKDNNSEEFSIPEDPEEFWEYYLQSLSEKEFREAKEEDRQKNWRPFPLHEDCDYDDPEYINNAVRAMDILILNVSNHAELCMQRYAENYLDDKARWPFDKNTQEIIQKIMSSNPEVIEYGKNKFENSFWNSDLYQEQYNEAHNVAVRIYNTWLHLLSEDINFTTPPVPQKSRLYKEDFFNLKKWFLNTGHLVQTKYE